MKNLFYEKLDYLKFILIDYKKQFMIFLIILLTALFSLTIYNTSLSSKKEVVVNDSFKDVAILNDNLKEKDSNDSSENINISKKIKVDIKGEVNKPGVYELDEDSRVVDVIDMAGGITENANTIVNNLSKKIKDEMVIIIYSKQEVDDFMKTKENQNELLDNSKDIEDIIENNSNIEKNEILDNIQTNNQNKENTQNSNKININTASIEDLMTLTGIGESKAKSIISYRENNGNFKNIDEIMNITGIGESTYAKFKDQITV